MNSVNENCNVTGVSKKYLADQLYKLMDEELCDMTDICDIDRYSKGAACESDSAA